MIRTLANPSNTNRKIPWCAACHRHMYQHMAKYQCSSYTLEKEVQALAVRMGCHFPDFPDFQRVVRDKILQSMKNKLRTLTAEGIICIYSDVDGNEKTYWAPETQGWVTEDWDNLRQCPIPLGLRQQLIDNGKFDENDDDDFFLGGPIHSAGLGGTTTYNAQLSDSDMRMANSTEADDNQDHDTDYSPPSSTSGSRAAVRGLPKCSRKGHSTGKYGRGIPLTLPLRFANKKGKKRLGLLQSSRASSRSSRASQSSRTST